MEIIATLKVNKVNIHIAISRQDKGIKINQPRIFHTVLKIGPFKSID